MRTPFTKRRSKLPPLQKALLAAWFLHQLTNGHIDEAEARRTLRAEVGLQWSILNAIQYLTGKEAAAALVSLPAGHIHNGLTKQQLLQMLGLANHIAANFLPNGGQLSAGFMVHKFKGLSGAT